MKTTLGRESRRAARQDMDAAAAAAIAPPRKVLRSSMVHTVK
jgi:hypothetical protein